MGVKDIVVLAAGLLGLGDQVQDELNGDGSKTLVESLVRCYNIVEKQLAVDYLPLTAEETFSSETGVVEFKNFSKKPVRILRATDGWGNDLPFKLFPEYVKTQQGKIVFFYAYVPEEKTIEQEAEVALQITDRLIAYGVACEYALACGLFEDASVWDKKFKDAISAVYRANPAKKISSRRWI